MIVDRRRTEMRGSVSGDDYRKYTWSLKYFPKGWFPKRHAKAYLFSDTASCYSDYCIKLFTF